MFNFLTAEYVYRLRRVRKLWTLLGIIENLALLISQKKSLQINYRAGSRKLSGVDLLIRVKRYSITQKNHY